MRTLRFFIKYSVADPDLQIREGGGADSKLFLSALRASFWSKNRGVGAGPLRAPRLDLQLVLVTKLPPPRSSTKILDIALAWGLRQK